MTDKSELEALLKATFPHTNPLWITGFARGDIAIAHFGMMEFGRILNHIRAEKAVAEDRERQFICGAYRAVVGEPPAGMSPLQMVGAIAQEHLGKSAAAEAAALERAREVCIAESKRLGGGRGDLSAAANDCAGEILKLTTTASRTALSERDDRMREEGRLGAVFSSAPNPALHNAMKAAREEGRKAGLAQAAERVADECDEKIGSGGLADEILALSDPSQPDQGDKEQAE